MDTTRFPELLRAIYDAVDELERMFPGRHFTPDGHLVGSLGEALAAHHYKLELLPASARCHDGSCDGRSVQIKATQGDRVALSSQPDFLLVLKLKRDGSFTEEYNGLERPFGHWYPISHGPRTVSTKSPVGVASRRRQSPSKCAHSAQSGLTHYRDFHISQARYLIFCIRFSSLTAVFLHFGD